jgi:hypothetical protein
MGMEQTVTFPGGVVPGLPGVRDLLAGRGFAVQVRMIDGELAFPDEPLPLQWRELRLGTPSGMVTLHCEGNRVRLVIWGNADAGLRQAWNALAWAFAAAGSGQVETLAGRLEADVFGRTAELPESFKA